MLWSVVFVCLLLVILTNVHQRMTSLLWLSSVPALAVPDATVQSHIVERYLDVAPSGGNRRPRSIDESSESYDGNITVRLKLFDDIAGSFRMSRKWQVVPSDPRIKKDQVDSNTCIVSNSIGGKSVQCLPSFIIMGFEKCSTTNLNIWLSYHPNLQGKWFEMRFFDKLKNDVELENRWPAYLRALPQVPGGEQGVGKYWTFEKSPSYATSQMAISMLARLMPNARLAVSIRNPTDRAYSHFLM